MKRIIAALFLILAIPAFPQAAPAAPPAPKKLTQAQQDHIDVAIKDFQILQTQLNAMQASVAAARNNALARIDELKKEMKLDDTWDYDEAQKAFVKKPEPAKAAEPAAKK